MGEVPDYVSGSYSFKSAKNFVHSRDDDWSTYINAHTKGICNVSKAGNVIGLHCTSGTGENVPSGGPRCFNLNVSYDEDVPKNVKIFPTMENYNILKLTWNFDGAVRIATYQFEPHKLKIFFTTIVGLPDSDCTITTKINMKRIPQV